MKSLNVGLLVVLGFSLGYLAGKPADQKEILSQFEEKESETRMSSGYIAMAPNNTFVDTYTGHDHDHAHEHEDGHEHEHDENTEPHDSLATADNTTPSKSIPKKALSLDDKNKLFYSKDDIQQMNEREYPPATQVLQAIEAEDFAQMFQDFDQGDSYSANSDEYVQQITQVLNENRALAGQVASVDCKSSYCLLNLTDTENGDMANLIQSLSEQAWWDSYAFYGENPQTESAAIILLNVNSNIDFMDQDYAMDQASTVEQDYSEQVLAEDNSF